MLITLVIKNFLIKAVIGLIIKKPIRRQFLFVVKNFHEQKKFPTELKNFMVLNKTLKCVYDIWLDSRKVFTWTKLFERFFCRAVSNFSLDVNVDK